MHCILFMLIERTKPYTVQKAHSLVKFKTRYLPSLQMFFLKKSVIKSQTVGFVHVVLTLPLKDAGIVYYCTKIAACCQQRKELFDQSIVNMCLLRPWYFVQPLMATVSLMTVSQGGSELSLQDISQPLHLIVHLLMSYTSKLLFFFQLGKSIPNFASHKYNIVYSSSLWCKRQYT